MNKLLGTILLSAMCSCALAQNDPDAPIGGEAVTLTEAQQARFDTLTANYRDDAWMAQPTVNITGIVEVGIPHRIDEKALVERLKRAHETWKSWKAGNTSIDTSTAFEVLKVPFFPGEPDFTLVYYKPYSSNERSHRLKIKHAWWLDQISLAYDNPDSTWNYLRGPSVQTASNLSPRKVYILYRLGDQVWHAIQIETN